MGQGAKGGSMQPNQPGAGGAWNSLRPDNAASGFSHGPMGQVRMQNHMAKAGRMPAPGAPKPSGNQYKMSIGAAFSEAPMAEARMQGIKKM